MPEEGSILRSPINDLDGPGADDACSTSGIERRSSPRVYDRFPVRLCGRDSGGERFEIDTVLDNIGFRGLYLRLGRNVDRGADVFIEVRLSSAKDESVFAPRVAIHGQVLRAEPKSDGSYGVAIEFHQRRFL
ncbi:MAG: PilZ domain-containing protein [Blastocatellia bacterium]